LGITPYFRSSRNIGHDATEPLPLPDNYLDIYQSEDVFEHLEYDKLGRVFDEIYRTLKPGGIFRLSVPDYGCDLYAARSVRNEVGEIEFDPGGGGAWIDGEVIAGGHLWFPTYVLVKDLFDKSRFGVGGEVEFLQYTTPDGQFVMKPIDFSVGYIQRVPGNDLRVADRPRPISIVVDARKKA
jgi:SAM-dependent methyltransferase